MPSLLADVRTRSYEAHAWPPVLGRAFRRNGFRTGLAALALVFSALLLATLANGQAIVSSDGSADFYGVIPHGVMVTTFGAVSIFVLVALAISGVRFWRDAHPGALGHGTGVGPARARRADASSPARQRQRLHVEPGSAHAVAALVSSLHVLRLRVVLRVHDGRSVLSQRVGLARAVRVLEPSGAARCGGWIRAARRAIGAGCLCDRRATRRLARKTRAASTSLFLALLFLTSLTGLALLVLRHSQAMGILLVVHLAVVLVLLLTLPYGKFVHGLYRLLALIRYHRERA